MNPFKNMSPRNLGITIIGTLISFILTLGINVLIGSNPFYSIIAPPLVGLAVALALCAIFGSFRAYRGNKQSEAMAVGSDHYVSTPEELQAMVKSLVIEPREEKALKLACEIIRRYAEIISLGGQTDEDITISNIDCSDRNVSARAESILNARGWNVVFYRHYPGSKVRVWPHRRQVEKDRSPKCRRLPLL